MLSRLFPEQLFSATSLSTLYIRALGQLGASHGHPGEVVYIIDLWTNSSSVQASLRVWNALLPLGVEGTKSKKIKELQLDVPYCKTSFYCKPKYPL